MIDTISRHRPLALLATVVLAQVLLLAFQIKRENNVRLIRYWAVELMTPLERAGTWTFSHVGGVWSGYVGLRNTRAENERLRDEVDTLRLRNRELESQPPKPNASSTLLNFHDAHTEAPMLAAQVIGASADPTSHTLFINRGERDHVRQKHGRYHARWSGRKNRGSFSLHRAGAAHQRQGQRRRSACLPLRALTAW